MSDMDIIILYDAIPRKRRVELRKQIKERKQRWYEPRIKHLIGCMNDLIGFDILAKGRDRRFVDARKVLSAVMQGIGKSFLQ